MSKLAALFLFLTILTAWVGAWMVNYGYGWVAFPGFLTGICFFMLFVYL